MMIYGKGFAGKLAALLLTAALLFAGSWIGTQAQSSASGQNTNRPRRASDAATSAASPSSSTPQAQPTPPPPVSAPTPPPQDDDDDDVVRVETDLTNTLFTAVDKNRRFVTNLQQSDVRVVEDGVPQEIFTFSRQTDLPLSLAIILDRSASQQYTLPEQKNAARAFLDSVVRPGKDETAVISFTGLVELEQDLTGSTARVRQAIDRVEYVPPSGIVNNQQVGTPPTSDTNQRLAGSTAVWDAVWLASKDVLTQSPERTRRAIILLTDGDDRDSQVELKDAVEESIKADVVVYSIGIGDFINYTGIDEKALRRLSERTGGRAFFPENDTELRAAFAQIQDELRSQYLVAYSSTNKSRNGQYRQVKLEVVNPELRKQNLRLTYRPGYFARSGGAAAPTQRQPQTRRP
ncbi:MAG: VWA domain-containing protein [Pyrinomonadaceae bacterium]|nr:VWA domain-containing protein [Pyrinomonadaceae bacterium]